MENSLGLTHFLQHLEEQPVSLAVLAVLAVMSILSWYLILSKGLRLALERWGTGRFPAVFHRRRLAPDWESWLVQCSGRNPFARLAQQGFHAAAHHARLAPVNSATICPQGELLARSLQQVLDQHSERLQGGMALLASISSTAPFIGLFGTVLGIYSALLSISARGDASLETVAAPVGEALIMTALGLVVAVPAVLGYNALLRGQRNLLRRLEQFAYELYTLFNTGEPLPARRG